MTPERFKAWQADRRLDDKSTALALGLARNTVSAYAKGKARIPLYVCLACAALSFGLPPIK
jgi:transcriptional regulator with XRE-family HTH domain